MAEENNNVELFDGIDLSFLEDVDNSNDNVNNNVPLENTGGHNSNNTDNNSGENSLSNTGENNTEDTSTEEGNEDDSNTEDSSAGDNDNNDNNDSSPLTTLYAKMLIEEGVLPNFTLEEGKEIEPASLKEAMVNEINSGINSYKEQLPPKVKHLINRYEEGVSLESLIELDNKITRYSSITKEALDKDSDLQKQILTEYYQSAGLPDERVKSLVKTSVDLENIGDEANAALKDLIALQDQEEQRLVDEAKQREEDDLKARDKALNDFKNTLSNTQEIIPGLAINQPMKDKILKTMTIPVGVDAYGNPLNKIAAYRNKNPYNFDMILSYMYEVTKGFQDWSIVTASGKKSAMNEFEEATKRSTFKQNTGSGNNSSQSNPGSKDLWSALENFELPEQEVIKRT